MIMTEKIKSKKLQQLFLNPNFNPIILKRNQGKGVKL